jgi:hypothetical protein
MQNKANPAGWPIVSNKPNLRRPGGRDTPSFHYSTIPAFQSDAHCAKQTQFPAEQKEGQRLGGKGVMVNSTFDRPRQNKANLLIADFGLRIQDGLAAVESAHYSSIPAFQSWGVGRGTDAPNEPNSRRRRAPLPAPRPSGLAPGPEAVVQTKPIPGGAKRRASAWRETSYGERHMQQASAKQSQFSGTAPKGRGTGESAAEPTLRRMASNKPNSCHYADPEIGVPGRARPHPTRGAIAPNKPNSARPAGRPAPWEEEMCETNPILARRAEPMALESATVCRPHPLRSLRALCGCDRAATAIECGKQCRGRRWIRWSAIARRKWHGDD